MLGVVLPLSLVMGVLYCVSYRFRSVVAGHKGGRISKIVDRQRADKPTNDYVLN